MPLEAGNMSKGPFVRSSTTLYGKAYPEIDPVSRAAAGDQKIPSDGTGSGQPPQSGTYKERLRMDGHYRTESLGELTSSSNTEKSP